MKRQVFNPYLPSWEYIPDGEPHVFDGRVYVYGSHDRANGYSYCLNDYVCWSAPEDDLSDWRYEGVIYRKTQEPLNPDGDGCLFAPDVTRGPDGRYYLYYVLDKLACVSVAVCDTPAGAYEFLGYVRYPDGTKLGEREGDEPQFDPGVLTEGEVTYLYTGFGGFWDRTRAGAMVTVLEPDMLTIRRAPHYIVPSATRCAGTGYDEHPFFEASSIRKIGKQKYCFVYSSTVMHELCYAVSDAPDGEFTFGGVLVSNADVHISTYKPAHKPMYYGANNHGGLVKIKDNWYIFYHRHTNGTNFSRQGMAERVTILPDGRIPQVEMTSCGLNGGPLIGKGEYPAHIACNLFAKTESLYTGGSGDNGFWLDSRFPRIVQDGSDGETDPAYIANLTDGATCGYKYFDCKGVCRIAVKTRGYASGAFEVRSAWDGEVLGRINVHFTSIWTENSAQIDIPDGIHALYFTYRGEGSISLLSFSLEA